MFYGVQERALYGGAGVEVARQVSVRVLEGDRRAPDDHHRRLGLELGVDELEQAPPEGPGKVPLAMVLGEELPEGGLRHVHAEAPSNASASSGYHQAGIHLMIPSRQRQPHRVVASLSRVCESRRPVTTAPHG